MWEDVTDCGRTGLRLVPSRGDLVWRVQKASYGPLSPLKRDPAADRAEWGRWDVPGLRTVYAADTVTGALMETLSWATRADLGTLGELFDEEDRPDAPVTVQVATEWQQMGGMQPGQVAAIWRQDRRLYQLQLPLDGWFVDIAHSHSLAAVNRQAALATLASNAEQLTLGDLARQNRQVTTEIAAWICEQVLFDGSSPQGIRYASKFGQDLACAAFWLYEAVDDRPRQVQVVDQRPIQLDDPDVRQAAANLNLQLF